MKKILILSLIGMVLIAGCIEKDGKKPLEETFDTCAELGSNAIKIGDRCMMYWYFTLEKFNEIAIFSNKKESLYAWGTYKVQNNSYEICEQKEIGKNLVEQVCVPKMIEYKWNITKVEYFIGLEDSRQMLYVYDTIIETKPKPWYPDLCQVRIFVPSSYSGWEYRGFYFDDGFIIAEIFC